MTTLLEYFIIMHVELHSFRVCRGFRLSKQGDFCGPLLTTFEKSLLLRHLGQYWKLAKTSNPTTITKFNQLRLVQICETLSRY